ncbi:MAG: VOC family protein [Patescibacteria group bacterium]
MDVRSFFDGAVASIAAFDDFSVGHQLIERATADHICYKCGSTASFEALRAMCEGESAFVYQSIIASRRIAIIRFRTPIKTALGDINVLELSDQKPDGSQVDRFDHIEIYPTHGSTNELVEYLRSKNVIIDTANRPHHVTHDLVLANGFKVRIEDEPLLEKIKREEIK